MSDHTPALQDARRPTAPRVATSAGEVPALPKTPPWDTRPTRAEHTDLLRIQVGATEVARYVDGSGSPDFDSPRPHLHPVRTPAGTVVTDASPADHTWHLGLSIGVQDVAGTNIWGGRTYLPEQGYTWRRDHGRVTHREWTQRTPGAVSHRLAWTDPAGAVLLEEERELSWVVLDPQSWRLDLSFTLHLPDGASSAVELGSPVTNGRDLAGYGGLFWRLPPCHDVDVRTPTASGEDAVHGSRPADGASWLAWSARSASDDAEFTVVAAPADPVTAHDPWFVRATSYPGLGSALAWARPAVVRGSAPLRRTFTLVVGDGRWDDDRIAASLERPRNGPDAAQAEGAAPDGRKDIR